MIKTQKFYQHFTVFQRFNTLRLHFGYKMKTSDKSIPHSEREQTMNIKKVSLVMVVLALMALLVGVTSAQEGTPEVGRGGRFGAVALRQLFQIVADETGLQVQEIVTQVHEGTTLADIITANNGSVDDVMAQAVTAATDHINAAVADGTITQERADQLLANLEAAITRGLNGELRRDGPDGRQPGNRERRGVRNLLQAIADATGLEQREILQQARDGSTLADIITANGGTVDAVLASAIAASTEDINTAVANGRLTQEQADELIASLPAAYTEALNMSPEARPGRPERPQAALGRGLLRSAAEQTGLEVSVIVEQLQAGSSLADILTANGVDVTTFIDEAVAQAETRLSQAVANGRLTQEQADERLTNLRDRLTDRINAAHTPTV
jgi:hypothetical protein